MHQVVPKASNVAADVHHLVPPTVAAPCAGGSALACPHTGAPCPALQALFAPLESVAPGGCAPSDDHAGPGPVQDDARAWLRALAPCGGCRVAFASGRDKLRHVRLGQRERDILLAASAADCLVVTEPGMTRSVSAARRRAALSLTKAGLLAAAPMPARAASPGVPRTQRATVALTPLGQYVMQAYGRFLSAGKPVRWMRPARGSALPGADPADLVEETLGRCQAALRETLNELKGVLVAAIGRPLKSPGLLDTVTRQLETKATLLRAVLEPRSLAPASGRTRRDTPARSPA